MSKDPVKPLHFGFRVIDHFRHNTFDRFDHVDQPDRLTRHQGAFLDLPFNHRLPQRSGPKALHRLYRVFAINDGMVQFVEQLQLKLGKLDCAFVF